MCELGNGCSQEEEHSNACVVNYYTVMPVLHPETQGVLFQGTYQTSSPCVFITKAITKTTIKMGRSGE